MARHQIKRTGEQGAGMALAGLLLGWATVALGVLAILGLTLFVVTRTGHAAGIVHAHLLPERLGVPQAPLPPPAP
jgi:hypothetical protein